MVDLNGQHVIAALGCALTQWNQVRVAVLKPSKAAIHMYGPLRQASDTTDARGLGPIELATCDDPTHEGAMLRSALPAVNAASTAGAQTPTGLPAFEIPPDVRRVFADTVTAIDAAAGELVDALAEASGPVVVGFDTEHSFKRGEEREPTMTIQLATAKTVYLFHVRRCAVRAG